MKKYLLYISGIQYGSYEFEGENVYGEERDVFSGCMGEKRKLSEEDRSRLLGLTRMDFFSIAAGMGEFERLAASGEERAVLEDGRIYEKGISAVAVGENTRQLADGACMGMEPEVMYMQRQVKFPLNLILDAAGKRLAGFLCPCRDTICILIEEGCEDQTVLKHWKRVYGEEKLHPVTDGGVHMVPMRDGVGLSTQVWLPGHAKGRVPAILVRTPYGKEAGHEAYFKHVMRGYAVVIQDVRGRNESEGEWLPNCHEVEDGDDTLNWIASREWSDGKVGTIGGSYLGYVQWAAAASGNPHLKAMVSIVTAGSAFRDLPRRGGCFVSGMMAWAFAVSQKKMNPALMLRDDWDEVLNIRPLDELPRRALGYDIPFLTEWLKHPDEDELWKRSDWQARGQNIKVPALIMSGWFDDDGMGTTQALELTKDYPEGMRKVILGPWQHSGNTCYDLHGMPFGNNAIRMDLDLKFQEWLDHYLKGTENGIERGPAVEYYTTGENRWKSADTWPVPETEESFFYLGSGSGNANTSGGDGVLVTEKGEEGYDSYLYDPANPAVHIIDMSENEVEVPGDYTQEEKRQDILCYTSPMLEEDMVITGDASVRLYVSSDAPDTDFVVRITDVDGEGNSRKLADGVLSARYRNGFDHAEFMEPGEIYQLDIRTTKFSHCFRAGHRIRLTVTSGAKNLIFPNSNTRDGFNSVEIKTAKNQVHHGGVHASGVWLRVGKEGRR